MWAQRIFCSLLRDSRVIFLPCEHILCFFPRCFVFCSLRHRPPYTTGWGSAMARSSSASFSASSRATHRVVAWSPVEAPFDTPFTLRCPGRNTARIQSGVPVPCKFFCVRCCGEYVESVFVFPKVFGDHRFIGLGRLR